eukprot:m.85301 g.85301  ORF g.85301 m.85301 type:complete len:112 (+) comp25858_c0_seq2:807-1142(+)
MFTYITPPSLSPQTHTHARTHAHTLPACAYTRTRTHTQMWASLLARNMWWESITDVSNLCRHQINVNITIIHEHLLQHVIIIIIHQRSTWNKQYSPYSTSTSTINPITINW